MDDLTGVATAMKNGITAADAAVAAAGAAVAAALYTDTDTSRTTASAVIPRRLNPSTPTSRRITTNNLDKGTHGTPDDYWSDESLMYVVSSENTSGAVLLAVDDTANATASSINYLVPAATARPRNRLCASYNDGRCMIKDQH